MHSEAASGKSGASVTAAAPEARAKPAAVAPISSFLAAGDCAGVGAGVCAGAGAGAGAAAKPGDGIAPAPAASAACAAPPLAALRSAKQKYSRATAFSAAPRTRPRGPPG